MTDKKEVFAKLNKCKSEVFELKTQLNQLNDQKEAWFNKKETYSKDISKLIKKVKQEKSQRDKFTSDVKKDKKNREKYNEKAKKKIEEVKKLNKEKREIQRTPAYRRRTHSEPDIGSRHGFLRYKLGIVLLAAFV